MKRRTLELRTLAKEFELHNRSEGKSASSVKWYNEVTDLFEDWLESEGMSNCLEDLGSRQVRQFILHLQDRPGLRGRATTHMSTNRVRALRSFFNWLYCEGYTEDHRLARLKPPKARHSERDRYTDGRGDLQNLLGH